MRSAPLPGENAQPPRSRPKATLARPWIWAVYLVLFALSVPWYLPADETPSLWLGLPYWVVLSVLVIAAIACFTAWNLYRYWPLDDEDGDNDNAAVGR